MIFGYHLHFTNRFLDRQVNCPSVSYPSRPLVKVITVYEPELKRWNEGRLVERRVTYTLEHNGQFYVVENVPARVNEETGEQLFAPATVERAAPEAFPLFTRRHSVFQATVYSL